jgi:hypothetical protein
VNLFVRGFIDSSKSLNFAKHQIFAEIFHVKILPLCFVFEIKNQPPELELRQFLSRRKVHEVFGLLFDVLLQLQILKKKKVNVGNRDFNPAIA